jgi:protein SCO1/2
MKSFGSDFMNSKSKIDRVFVLILTVGAFLCSTAWAHVPIPPNMPGAIGRRVVKVAVPDFKLKDQEGKPFDFAKARGKLVLVTFIYTTCTDVCPLLTAKFAAIQRTLEARKNHDYLLLSITTDPETDTSSTLRDYGDRYKADFSHWSFLTGSRAELSKVWKDFGVHVVKNQSGQVQHTTFTTLVDRQGERRIDYYGDKWREKEVLQDMEWLRKPN